MKRITVKTFFMILILAFALSGCLAINIASSPQEAAMRSVATHGDPTSIVDQGSIVVRQTQFSGQSAFVLVTYSQLSGARHDQCTTVFETKRSRFGGWSPSSSTGACGGTEPGQPTVEEPMTISGGSSGTIDSTNPGFSHVSGRVNQADIVKVRVTWQDGTQQEAGVVNGSYLIIRASSGGYQTVEGLNTDGQVVYSNMMGTPANK